MMRLILLLPSYLAAMKRNDCAKTSDSGEKDIVKMLQCNAGMLTETTLRVTFHQPFLDLWLLIKVSPAQLLMTRRIVE